MKKFLALLLALVMSLSLVACGGNSDGGNISNLAPATTAPAPAAEAPEALRLQNGGIVLGKILVDIIWRGLPGNFPQRPILNTLSI